MKGKAGTFLIGLGAILYLIISIIPYILIGLVVIAIIAFLLFFSVNSETRNVNKETSVYVQTYRTKSINPIRIAKVPPSSIKSTSFVEDQKLIQTFVNAYIE